MRRSSFISKLISIFVVSITLASLDAPPAHAATYYYTVKEAQTIMNKFGIPAGPADGYWGAQTAQGLCAFRQISGLTVSRNILNSTDLAKLRSYNKSYATLSAIPQPTRTGASTYLYANETCQTMTLVKYNRAAKVMKISTGIAGHGTPNGTFSLGSTVPGWYCSTLYPSCSYNYVGENARTNTKGVLYSRWGNMYNRRQVSGNIFVHGSTSVPTYPASHGCIRVTVADSDWMWHYVGKIPIFVVGAY